MLIFDVIKELRKSKNKGQNKLLLFSVYDDYERYLFSFNKYENLPFDFLICKLQKNYFFKMYSMQCVSKNELYYFKGFNAISGDSVKYKVINN